MVGVEVDLVAGGALLFYLDVDDKWIATFLNGYVPPLVDRWAFASAYLLERGFE